VSLNAWSAWRSSSMESKRRTQSKFSLSVRMSRFNEAQIIGVLREQESGATTAEVCRRHGISEQTFYRWKAKYGGMTCSPEVPKVMRGVLGVEAGCGARRERVLGRTINESGRAPAASSRGLAGGRPPCAECGLTWL